MKQGQSGVRISALPAGYSRSHPRVQIKEIPLINEVEGVKNLVSLESKSF